MQKESGAELSKQEIQYCDSFRKINWDIISCHLLGKDPLWCQGNSTMDHITSSISVKEKIKEMRQKDLGTFLICDSITHEVVRLTSTSKKDFRKLDTSKMYLLFQTLFLLFSL